MQTSRSFKQNIQRKLLLRLIPRKSDRGGFTLIELLVSMIVTSLIVSGMLYLVVEVLGINQKDSSRNDTQRDMQMAIDYITRDLREAMYVYGVEDELIDPANQNGGKRSISCLSASLDHVTRGKASQCTGLLPYLPKYLSDNTDNIPVLAFWKPEPLPEKVTKYCFDNRSSVGLTIANNAIDRIPCVAQRMYTLVVYSLDKKPDTIWRGRARIRRYTLPHFTESFDGQKRNSGWVAPVSSDDKRPMSWPYGKTDGGVLDLQKNRASSTIDAAGDPSSSIANNVVLTDFVDFDKNIANGAPFALTPTPTQGSGYCPSGFEVPNFGKFRPEFYACVRKAAMNENPEVRVVIKGNAAGRGGIPLLSGEVPFQMESHVIGRSAYGKQRSGG